MFYLFYITFTTCRYKRNSVSMDFNNNDASVAVVPIIPILDR